MLFHYAFKSTYYSFRVSCSDTEKIYLSRKLNFCYALFQISIDPINKCCADCFM